LAEEKGKVIVNGTKKGRKQEIEEPKGKTILTGR
jgi:hypothetical protein